MKIEWKTCFRVGLSIFLLYLCINYWMPLMKVLGAVFSAASPLFVGFIIAYLINILMCFYEKHYFPGKDTPFIKKSKRPICLIAAFVTMFVVIALILVLIVPQLISCVKLILEQIPPLMRNFVAWANGFEYIPKDFVKSISAIDWQSKIEQIIKLVTNGVGGVMDTVLKTATSVLSGVVSAFLGLIFSVYLLVNRDTLIRQSKAVMNHYLKETWCKKIYYVVSVLNKSFKRFIIGQCTEAVILGVLCIMGMAILRLPYAAMISALVAFTSLIPIAGPYIGSLVGAFMILTVSPVKALVFLVFVVILQQFEGNVIYPRVVGSSINLPGIWVLAAVTIGGGLFGIGGMLLGVPLTAAIYRIIKNDMRNPRI